MQRKAGSNVQMQYAFKRSLDQERLPQGKLQAFEFSPIETPYGSLKVNNAHQTSKALENVKFEIDQEIFLLACIRFLSLKHLTLLLIKHKWPCQMHAPYFSAPERERNAAM